MRAGVNPHPVRAGGPREAHFEGLVTLSELTDDEQADFMAYHDNPWVDVE